MSTKKSTKKKKKSTKKSVKKAVAKKAPKVKLTPEEIKTKLVKLYKELGTVEDDQKEKKNIRAKLRSLDKNWKNTLGVKSEKKTATKKKTKKKAAKSTSGEANKTKKKKKKVATA